MKKIFGGISVAAIMLVCLTGCGKSNTLKCTGKIDGNDATMTATLSDNKVVKIVGESKEVLETEDAAKQEAALVAGLGSIMADQGVVMSATANGKNVTTKITFDVTKMSDDTLESQLGTKDLTKDAFVKAMEGQGLTCK